jgi:hypothetical protein
VSSENLISGYRKSINEFREGFEIINKNNSRDIGKIFNEKAKKLEEKLSKIIPFQNNEFSSETFFFSGILEMYGFCANTTLEPLRESFPDVVQSFETLVKKLLKQFDGLAYKLASLNNIFHEMKSKDHEFKHETIIRTNELVEKMEKLMKENDRLSLSLAEQKHKANQERSAFMEEVSKIQKENNQYVENLANSQNMIFHSLKRKNSNLAENPREKIPTSKFTSNDSAVINREFQGDSSDQYLSTTILKGAVKSFTGKQLSLCAYEILDEKISYNNKCKESGGIPEPLSRFLPTYFIKKYGLKKIASEWQLGFQEALKNCSKSDIISLLFNLILNDDIDENFYFIFKEARDLIKKTLKVN